AVILASFPGALAGVLFRDYIQQVIYETPLVICLSLVIGGIVLLLVDRMPKRETYDDIMQFPWHVALVVGLFQMLALIPGVSRSWSNVLGAMLLRVSKRSPVEFTFFIAYPIMLGAYGYDLYKCRELTDMSLGLNIAIGFAASLVVGALVVRYLLDFVS